MRVQVERQSPTRKQATESDGNSGHYRYCQENIFQPGELSIQWGRRGKYRKEVVEKRPRKPGHHNFVADCKSSQRRSNRAFEQWSACDKTAKKQRQKPRVRVIRP